MVGRGANGIVYRCRHIKTKKIYAVKKNRCDIENMAHVKASFAHTKKLCHHGIIGYKGLYITPQKRVSYLVMEYFDYPELKNVRITDKK